MRATSQYRQSSYSAKLTPNAYSRPGEYVISIPSTVTEQLPKPCNKQHSTTVRHTLDMVQL
jgi:hypothetical protein